MNARRMADFTAFFQRRPRLQRLLTGMHITLYRLSGGAMGGMVEGVPNLLLTTTGRKSGKKFTTPLFYFTHDGAWVVVASAAGAASDPNWWKNLQANPEAQVQVGPHRFRVRAEAAPEELKQRLWPFFALHYPAYDEYQKRTERSIPLVMLRPV